MGCGTRDDAAALVRLVLDDSGTERPGKACGVVVDAKGGSFGRGAHVHPTQGCLERAGRGLGRAFRCEVSADPVALAEAIRAAYTRRLAGLIGGGARAGLIAVGTDAVTDALRAGRVGLLLVAGDAAAAAQRTEMARAIAEGRSLPLWDRARLGLALGRASAVARDGVAVAGILDAGLASVVRDAWVAANVSVVVRGAAAPTGEPAPREVGCGSDVEVKQTEGSEIA